MMLSLFSYIWANRYLRGLAKALFYVILGFVLFEICQVIIAVAFG